MVGKANFVYWQESPHEEIPNEPMFLVVSSEKGLDCASPITGQTLIETYGIPVPLFPDLATWKREVDSKRRCCHCWATIKTNADYRHHMQRYWGTLR